MEVKVVRFSRPILIRVCKFKDDYLYQTVYGFMLPEDSDLDDPIIQMRIEQYSGYLAGLHCWSSGDELFKMGKDYSWIDETDTSHYRQDEWMILMELKCLEKLGLTYDVVTVEVDEEELNHYLVNEENMVVSEEFYYDLQRYKKDDAPCEEVASSEYDDLPF